MNKSNKPILTTNDFKAISYSNDCVEAHLAFKTTSEIFSNLVRDGYFGVLEDNHGREYGDDDRNEILDRTGATGLAYFLETDAGHITEFVGPAADPMTLEIYLSYSNDERSNPRTLNIEEITQGLSDAANIIVPRAQERVLQSLKKRYGIKQPK